MLNLAVIGAQWGDEGKGKVVDRLSDRFDVVARFQGGPNAGHTVTFDGTRHALHHIPSGVFRDDVKVVIGNGTVLDPVKLLEEIDGLSESGIDLTGRLFISDRASVILPLMKLLDAALEASRSADVKIGTTLRGIGPTYQAKAARTGVRMGDLLYREVLLERVTALHDSPMGRSVRESGVDPGDPAATVSLLLEQGEHLRPFIADTSMLLNDWIDAGSNVLFEGAQGTLLDLDHGTYPFVTSSTTMGGGLCGGLGISPTMLTGILGVFKAYCTRVGSGPMPTELDDGPDGFGQKLRDRGHEYGTTTGRPRRCGWFDGVAARYVNRINRYQTACITLLDVLDEFREIGICTGYRLDGREIDSMPSSAGAASRIEPVFEFVPGWMQNTTGARDWNDLPQKARDYLDRLGEIIGTEVGMVGVGPDRIQTIVKPGSWLETTLTI